MGNKYKDLISNTLIFAIGSFGSKLIAFFLVPLYTNVLTTEQYGTADLIITFANLAVPIFSLVIQDAVLRFGLSGKHSPGAVCKNSFWVLLIGSLLSLGIVPLVNMYASLSEWRWYIYIILVTNMFCNVSYAYARSIEKNKVYAIAGIINTLFLAVANIVFLLFFKLEIKGYLWANIGAHVISVIFLMIFTGAWKDMIKEKTDTLLMKQMIAFSAPLIVNNLSWWVLTSSNRIMIEFFCSTEELGLFTAASKIPNLLSIITSIFSAAWTASSIKEYETENDKSFFSNIFKVYSLIMFFGGSFILLILKWFMQYYVGKAFYESWRYVPLILIGTIMYSFATFYESIYQALKKSVKAAITTIIAATVNLLISFLLIKHIGVFASCLSLFVSYLILCVIRMADSKRFFYFKVNNIAFIISTITITAQAVCLIVGINEILIFAIAMCILLLVNAKDLKDCAKVIQGIVMKKFVHKK